MSYKVLSNLTALLIGGCALTAQADILMKWQRIPLSVDLQVEKERIILVDKNVKVGYPKSLDGKIRLQSTGGAVYIKALEAFPTARLQLKDMMTNEIILIDVAAKEKIANPEETIRLVYEGKLENQPSNFNQNDEFQEITDIPVPQLPVPAALTRYAAQMLYAPLRTVEPVAGVRQVAHRLPTKITTLLPALPVTATPLMSWQLDDYIVTAVRLQNRGTQRLELDPRELQGRFYAATFQHAWLGGAGSTEDTTTVYLVTEGYPNKAFIPETKLYSPPKKLKKTTKIVVKKVIDGTRASTLSKESQNESQ
ncbi:TIGR03749 family integrating conjugative element protein [Conservatibacter flavescens]|uniref:TIGR03749 family integrating conjugative element protein n=1 Tax=Conservatibacter flavescens TaxID=28161 RepID=A0A2M8S112_9PAST|nr:TIGR03749 family integrating conjugative element protein [Conservatibacter flavescens]PJG84808.1 TIGR03749 family integrating conjugative element protein [Conservatibacter flavescens]